MINLINLLGLKTTICATAQTTDSSLLSDKEKENNNAREDLNIIISLQTQIMALLKETSLFTTKELMEMISGFLNADGGYIGFNNKDLKFLSSDVTSGEQILSILLNSGISQIKDASIKKFIGKNPTHPLVSALQSNLNTWPDITYIKLALNSNLIDNELKNFSQEDWKKFFGVILFSKEKINEDKPLSEEELQKTIFVLNINALQNYITSIFRDRKYSEEKIAAILDCLKCFLWSYINALEFRLSAMLYVHLEEKKNQEIPVLKSMKGENNDNFMHYISLPNLVKNLPNNEDLQRFMNAVDGFGELIRFLFYLGSTIHDSTVEAVEDFMKERFFICSKEAAEKKLNSISLSDLSKLHVYMSKPEEDKNAEKPNVEEELKKKMKEVMISSTFNNFIKYEVLLQMLASFNRLWGKVCKQIKLSENVSLKDTDEMSKETKKQEHGSQQKIDSSTTLSKATTAPKKKAKKKSRVLG